MIKNISYLCKLCRIVINLLLWCWLMNSYFLLCLTLHHITQLFLINQLWEYSLRDLHFHGKLIIRFTISFITLLLLCSFMDGENLWIWKIISYIYIYIYIPRLLRFSFIGMLKLVGQKNICFTSDVKSIDFFFLNKMNIKKIRKNRVQNFCNFILHNTVINNMLLRF